MCACFTFVSITVFFKNNEQNSTESWSWYHTGEIMIIKCWIMRINNIFTILFLRDIPERLPITRTLRIKSATPVTFLVDKYKTTNPMFYRSYTNLRTGGNGKHKLQYFINTDWSSEKLSWTNFHKNVPEFHKVNWVCWQILSAYDVHICVLTSYAHCIHYSKCYLYIVCLLV